MDWNEDNEEALQMKALSLLKKTGPWQKTENFLVLVTIGT